MKTVTDKSTTTLIVNAKRCLDHDIETLGVQKRDVEAREHDDRRALVAEKVENHLKTLKDRALFDFAAIAKLFGYSLAVGPVASACSCFSSIYTPAAKTITVTAQTPVTVAVAKATVTTTTTVKGFTV